MKQSVDGKAQRATLCQPFGLLAMRCPAVQMWNPLSLETGGYFLPSGLGQIEIGGRLAPAPLS